MCERSKVCRMPHTDTIVIGLTGLKTFHNEYTLLVIDQLVLDMHWQQDEDGHRNLNSGLRCGVWR